MNLIKFSIRISGLVIEYSAFDSLIAQSIVVEIQASI